MKTLERLIQDQLHPMVSTFPNTLQFASHLGVEDHIILLRNRLYTNLDHSASSARIRFFDFSSFFDNIRLTLEKLTEMQVGASLVSWCVTI